MTHGIATTITPAVTYQAVISPARDEATLDLIGGLELTVIRSYRAGCSGPMFSERFPYLTDIAAMIEAAEGVLARNELRAVGEWVTQPVGNGDGEWTTVALERTT